MFTFCKARWERGKKWKENNATKVTKIPKTKRQKYGMNETLESIRRRLNHFGTDPIAFGQCLHFIKEETLERLKNTKFGIQRMTIDSKPSTQFRPCQFYQSDQCRQTIYRFLQYPNFLVYISVLAENLFPVFPVNTPF